MELENAATGTKTIYFDNNDIMYTEEEVMHNSSQVASLHNPLNQMHPQYTTNFGSNLTKMRVKVPEQERKRFQEV